ncbi:MAG: type II secretion system minor pseudopilin GspK [Acidiferrobacterales bacterium]|nr:type II secretion system minor pseudopilin GspK [Acidiferrobacterales bacterium]
MKRLTINNNLKAHKMSENLIRRNSPVGNLRLKHQRGLAIITVLLIVALMVTLLGFLAEQQHLLIRRIGNQNIAEKGYQYALGVNAWAQQVLIEDQNRLVDYLGEDWAEFGKSPELDSSNNESFSLTPKSLLEKQELPTIDFGNEAELEFELVDLQARFNLNNLANKNTKIEAEQGLIFRNLLEVLGIDNAETRQQLYSALRNWLDENKEGSYESIDYLAKDLPYHASDQKLVNLAELRFVEGFTPELIALLEPFVVVLPVDYAKLNINTASAEVLASLNTSPVVNTGSVEQFLFPREDLDTFLGFDESSIELAKNAIIAVNPVGSPIVENMMQTSSSFFRVNAKVRIGDYNFCMQTVLLRENADAEGQTSSKVFEMNRQHDTFSLCQNVNNNTVSEDENLY